MSKLVVMVHCVTSDNTGANHW